MLSSLCCLEGIFPLVFGTFEERNGWKVCLLNLLIFESNRAHWPSNFYAGFSLNLCALDGVGVPTQQGSRKVLQCLRSNAFVCVDASFKVRGRPLGHVWSGKSTSDTRTDVHPARVRESCLFGPE